MTRSTRRAGSTRPPTSPRPSPGCRRASARRAWPAASSRPAASTSACWSPTRRTPSSAARFTRSGVLAAPVLLTQERCRLDAIRAVVANAGNANAATGRRGLEDAARMQGAAPRWPAGVPEDQVAVASTGRDRRAARRRQGDQGHRSPRARELAPYGDDTFGEAIRTTDKFAKSASLEVALPSGTVRLTAQAKGAGMISPAFATMLCFVQTDAALAPRPPTCCSASASSAPSTASRSTASSPPTTPRS